MRKNGSAYIVWGGEFKICCLIISNQYHIVFAYRGEGVGCTPPPIYLHSLTEASVGGMLAVGRIVGVTTTEGCYAKV